MRDKSFKIVRSVLHPSVIGPHVQRLANLPVDLALRQPARGGVLADFVRQVLHSPTAAWNIGREPERVNDLLCYIAFTCYKCTGIG